MRYLDLSISEIHAAIKEGKTTPKELVLEALKRAKEDDNNAFEYITEQEALAQVEALDPSRIDEPFYGIPFVLKDNFSTKDIPTTGSSNILNGYTPVFSAEVYDRLIKGGAILIGKTTLDELAMGGTGTTGHKGISYNPWDKKHEHLIGGSSCGSAIAISKAIAPLAIGSDTGDSVRKPASNGGSVGFKPSWGRISRFGMFPFAPSLDHVAYFTRNVKDSAITLNLLAGRDNKDATSSLKEVEDYTLHLDDSIKGRTIGIIKEVVDSISDKVILKAFNDMTDKLKEAGAIVKEVSINIDLLKALFPTYIVISCAEATSNNANLDGIKFGPREPGMSYEEIVTKNRTKGFSELIRRRFVIGSYSLLRENQDVLFRRAQKCRRLIVNAVNKALEECDAIIAPAAPSTAPLVNAGTTSNKLSNEYLIADNYLGIANLGGLPSITLPLGFKEGLPFGVNLTGRAFEESLLLNIANEYEKLSGLKDLIAKEDR